MWEIFEELMNEENLSISEVARRIGCRPSTLTDWRAGRSTPKADKLYQMAKLFGVSMEYILTGEKTPADTLLPSERELLHLFRLLSPAGKQAAINALKDFQNVTIFMQKKTEGKAG